MAYRHLLAGGEKARIEWNARRRTRMAAPCRTSWPRGFWGRTSRAYSYVALQSDLDLPAITAHYATQLEEAGWNRSGEGADGPQAWTTWGFRDNKGHPWTAALTALSLPASPRRYLLNLRADRIPVP